MSVMVVLGFALGPRFVRLEVIPLDAENLDPVAKRTDFDVHSGGRVELRLVDFVERPDLRVMAGEPVSQKRRDGSGGLKRRPAGYGYLVGGVGVWHGGEEISGRGGRPWP